MQQGRWMWASAVTIFGLTLFVQLRIALIPAENASDTMFSAKGSMARMPRIVDFQSADDPRDVVHRIVQTLAEGEPVGLPTETGYAVAAHALQPSTAPKMERIRQRLGTGKSVLALKHPLESLDYVPQMGPLGRKLVRRFWPGPVTLLFDGLVDGGLLEGGLAGALPAATRREL